MIIYKSKSCAPHTLAFFFCACAMDDTHAARLYGDSVATLLATLSAWLLFSTDSKSDS